MRRGVERGPEPLKEILARLMAARGWGRRQGRLHLERAWEEAVGEEHARRTRVLGLRRGVLEVEVAGSVLLQELAHYHKRGLLKKVKAVLPNETIQDLRFRAAAW
jgi:predicted nucleic acid-binding Zn ribbon protein